MTTVAADKEMMASDSLMVDGCVKTSCQKMWRIRGWLIGGAGGYTDILKVVAEMKHHKHLSPKQVLEKVDLKVKEATMLLLSPAGKLYLSEDGGDPIEVQEAFAAVGTGAQGAMAAMYHGASPKEAVKIMMKVDPNTGGRLRTYKL